MTPALILLILECVLQLVNRLDTDLALGVLDNAQQIRVITAGHCYTRTATLIGTTLAVEASGDLFGYGSLTATFGAMNQMCTAGAGHNRINSWLDRGMNKRLHGSIIPFLPDF